MSRHINGIELEVVPSNGPEQRTGVVSSGTTMLLVHLVSVASASLPPVPPLGPPPAPQPNCTTCRFPKHSWATIPSSIHTSRTDTNAQGGIAAHFLCNTCNQSVWHVQDAEVGASILGLWANVKFCQLASGHAVCALTVCGPHLKTPLQHKEDSHTPHVSKHSTRHAHARATRQLSVAVCALSLFRCATHAMIVVARHMSLVSDCACFKKQLR